jgi:autotransporter-associated beta strand protein
MSVHPKNGHAIWRNPISIQTQPQKPMKSRSNPFLALALVLVSSATLQAALYWNANSGSPDYSGSWNDIANNWNTATAGAGTQTTWTPGDDAEFDVAATYTVTVDAEQTATNLNIKTGALTFSGTNTISSSNLTIDSGASLTADSNRFLKAGTTTLTVNGTLTQTAAVSANTQRVILADGNGSIVFSGGLRTGGIFNFAGNISGNGSILTDAGGAFTLSGNNTYTGDTLLRNANILRIGSATALSPNTFIRTGGGCVFELTTTDFSRAIAASGAGNMRVGNAADVGATTFGFAAVNDDRNVALTGTVLWGSTAFNPTVFNLGTSASTHKVTLTTDIDLNAASRTFGSINGSADVEGEVSGVISGATGSILTKTGTGVLLLSNANTHPGGTVIAGSQGAINPLRISNADALGTGPLTIGGGGNNDRARLELTGGITITNPIPSLTSRSDANHFPNIVNVSGNNTIGTNISAGAGGSRTTIESAADKLTLGGSVSVRHLNLFGEGDGEISGNVTVGTGYILNKDGGGKWTIGGNMSNSTGVTIAEGTLQIGNGGATGSLGLAPITNDGALIFDRTGAVSIPGAISGSGTLTKRGSSAITLSSSTIAHKGNTSIEAGTLIVTGDATNATGDVFVGDGTGAPASAVLGGTGVIGGNVMLGADGAIAPGVTSGDLLVYGDVSGIGSIEVQIDAATSDSLTLDGGTLNITNLALNLSLLNAPTEAAYVIVNADSPITGGSFASVAGVPFGYSVVYSYNDGVDTHNIALVGTPSSNPFGNWATSNGLAGANAAANADPDNDGLDNLIEFVIGGQPNPANADANSNEFAPTGSTDANHLIFTYRRTDLALTQPGIRIIAEYGSDLAGWTPATHGLDGVTVVTTEDHFGTGIDRIEVTIPKGLATGTKTFARLNVRIP